MQHDNALWTFTTSDSAKHTMEAELYSLIVHLQLDLHECE